MPTMSIKQTPEGMRVSKQLIIIKCPQCKLSVSGYVKNDELIKLWNQSQIYAIRHVAD